MPARVVVLSIDVPGGRHGGYAVATFVGGTLRSVTTGTIAFDPAKREAEDYRILFDLIQRFRPRTVVCEQPFLHSIAQYIGGIKMACVLSGVSWWQVGPSKAKVLVLGDGRGRAGKETVREWAENTHGKHVATNQHVADALLYLGAWLRWRHRSEDSSLSPAEEAYVLPRR